MATAPAPRPPIIGVCGHPLTDEQQNIISQPPAVTRKWQAFSGCSKTTVSEEFTHAWSDHPALYLAFNNSIAGEARGRFPRHVQTQTAHGHAYSALQMHRHRDRIVSRIRPNDLDACAGLLRPVGNMSEITLRRAILKSLNNFLISGDDQVSKHHMAFNLHVRDAVLPMTAAIIERFMDFEASGLPITHDIYLKAFARSSTISDAFSYLIVDEAQDLNEVLIDIVRKAKRPAMIVGDPWQSIYSFRGAVSAMDHFDAPVMPLTRSFRFGPELAAVANQILSESLQPPQYLLLGNEAKTTAISAYNGKVRAGCTILARTNFRLFEGLVHLPLAFHVIGGIDEMLKQVELGYGLFMGRPTTLDPMLAPFSSWEACKDAAENEEDPDLSRLVKIIEQYTSAIPSIIAKLRRQHVDQESRAAFVVSTAHKAKGREWKHVVVLDDFLTITDLRSMLSKRRITPVEYNSEINLTYVTLTRAIESLRISQPLYDDLAVRAGLAR